MDSSPYAGEIALRPKIANADAAESLKAAGRHLNFATARLGLRLFPGAKILDFGCGIGTSVSILLAQGYDAYGVDVLEYWDRDFDKFWHIADKPPAELAARLRTVDLSNYRLPFEDGTFDFCFSDQVFEHVFDYGTTMSEIARVLRPGGVSLHNFPGPNNLIEGHVTLPFPWLCYSRAYLTFCSWLRVIRGTETDWRRRAEIDAYIMRFNNYPTKRKLRSIARSAGVKIEFAEADEFMFREGSALKTRLLGHLRKLKLERLVVRIVGIVLLQRYMVLRRADP
jgi:SAM-dependent methyltransferase